MRLREFYYPIAKGRLEIIIKEFVLNSSTIEGHAKLFLTDQEIHKKKSSFTTNYREFIKYIILTGSQETNLIRLNPGWDKNSLLSENFFPEGALEILKKSLSDSKVVGIRCPVTIKPKQGVAVESHFDVFLQIPDEIEKSEEAYIRKDLLIGGEKHISSSPYLPKARGLTLIEEEKLSTYLVMAEMPNHLVWNGSRQRLHENYKNSQPLSAVRNAMPKLLSFLVEGDIKRDMKALAKFFKKPAEELKTKDKQKDDMTKPIVAKPDDPNKIPSFIKPFRLEFGQDNVRVVPNGIHLNEADLPIHCILEMAYEGLDQDPFTEYDPFDFDISDKNSFPLYSSGMNVFEQVENRIQFEVISKDFNLSVSGFETNVRLKARLTYKENSDEATIGE